MSKKRDEPHSPPVTTTLKSRLPVTIGTTKHKLFGGLDVDGLSPNVRGWILCVFSFLKVMYFNVVFGFQKVSRLQK